MVAGLSARVGGQVNGDEHMDDAGLRRLGAGFCLRGGDRLLGRVCGGLCFASAGGDEEQYD